MCQECGVLFKDGVKAGQPELRSVSVSHGVAQFSEKINQPGERRRRKHFSEQSLEAELLSCSLEQLLTLYYHWF